jgi:RNA recognition motif-containing protein
VHTLIRDTNGQVVFKHQSGELSHVTIEIASLGSKRVRVVNLPPEVENDTLRNTLAPYGKILDIQNEKWSKAYRYTVDNEVRQVTMCLLRHVTSHLTVAGQRVLLSYEGQPATCYGCGAEDHKFQGCPARNRPSTVKERTTKQSTLTC